jgi:hypothetical protein
MKVRELIELLQALPGDLRVSTRDSIDKVAVRDFVDRDGEFERVALLYHSNVGLVGFEPLTDEIAERKIKDVLRRLSESPFKRGASQIFCNGRSRRLYSNYGGSEDWKYGDDIDLRIWKVMLEKGFVEEVKKSGWESAQITDLGRQQIATEAAS